MVLGKLDRYMQKNEIRIPYSKIKSKWIIKLIEENIGRTHNDIKQSKIFYDPPPSVTEIKNKIKQVGPD